MIPGSISGGEAGPDGGCPTLERCALDAISVDGVIYRFAEIEVLEPIRFLWFDKRFSRFLIFPRVEIEAYPIAIEADP